MSEAKADEQEPRASIMRERRKAAESQRHVAERQEQTNGDACRHEDHDADSCPHQTERHFKTERAEENRAISGPQSMLNMFKARADAAIEASGNCPSFTDRESQPVLTVSCSVNWPANIRVFDRDDTIAVQNGPRRYAGDRTEIGAKSKARSLLT